MLSRDCNWEESCRGPLSPSDLCSARNAPSRTTGPAPLLPAASAAPHSWYSNGNSRSSQPKLLPEPQPQPQPGKALTSSSCSSMAPAWAPGARPERVEVGWELQLSFIPSPAQGAKPGPSVSPLPVEPLSLWQPPPLPDHPAFSLVTDSTEAPRPLLPALLGKRKGGCGGFSLHVELLEPHHLLGLSSGLSMWRRLPSFWHSLNGL